MQEYICNGFMYEMEKLANPAKLLKGVIRTATKTPSKVNMFKGRKVVTGRSLYGAPPQPKLWTPKPTPKIAPNPGRLSASATKSVASAPNVYGRKYSNIV